jgi:tetratricopeptide (TPR) repeat protein
MRFLLAIVAAVLLPGTARAEWFEASSAHFVVLADDSERDIRKFSEQLERYHEAMAVITQRNLPSPSPSNRVTVYVVRNAAAVQRLAGTDSRALQGFYLPRAGGSVAYVPRVDVRNGQPDLSMVVLLHEYAHHFLISNSSFPDPRWVSEGAAEFFAATEFLADGGVKIGMPSVYRYGELAYARDVKAEELIDPALYESRRGKGYDAFYGKSWLLYHYLTMEPPRRGQMAAYLRGLREGKPSRAAAEAAFGDLEQLERELQRYMDRRQILSLVFRPDQLEMPQVAVRRLTAGEEAMMPVVIRSKRGVTREQASEIVADARAIAARYPGDAAVLAALAEAEHDAGNDTEAIAAADAALAIDPSRVNAYVQKGYALFTLAPQADDREAAYRAAREPFLALNRIENDHPLPLIYYNRYFAERGVQPPENAAQALVRAAELAPFDFGLRLNLAIQQLHEGLVDEARQNLLPIAYNPHGGPLANGARTVIERIDGGTPPDGRELQMLLSSGGAQPISAGAAEGGDGS